jgi:hypothetical protein
MEDLFYSDGARLTDMKKALIFAAVAEAATGLALLIVPSLVGHLLLGEDLTGIAVPVARVAGIALIGLGVACWPDAHHDCGRVATAQKKRA